MAQKKPLVAHKPDHHRVVVVAEHPDTGEMQRLEFDDNFAWDTARDIVSLGDQGSENGHSG